MVEDANFSLSDFAENILVYTKKSHVFPLSLNLLPCVLLGT